MYPGGEEQKGGFSTETDKILTWKFHFRAAMTSVQFSM